MENEYVKQSALKMYLLSRHNKYTALNYKLIQKQHYSIQARTLYIFIYHNFNKLIDKNTVYEFINHLNNYPAENKIIQYNQLKINFYNNWIYIE